MEKLDRLDAVLDERDLVAVWFARPNSFAWLLGGDNVVDRAGDVGVAAVGYDGDLRVVTDNIEAARLREEELSRAPADVDVEAFDWYEASLAAAVAARSRTPAAADFEVPGFELVDASALRQPLTDGDVEAYRDLGRTVAAAVESACRAAAPDDAEREVAADLRADLAAAGVETPVALVGGAERAQRYRHYTPTAAELGDYALVSVTAERGGLSASCTRTVAFDPPEWLSERHRAAARVEATALAATREVAAGRGTTDDATGTAGDVFEAIRAAYDAVGWLDEWREHHQGGAAGYAGREWIATPDADDPVTAPMAYAWNPTVPGAKSEDTALVTADGVESLTATGEWPTVAVRVVDRAGTVERPAVLRG